MSNKKISIYIVFFLLFTSCKVAPITTPSEKIDTVKPSVETKKELSRAEQKEKAFNLFNEILTLTETADRQSVLPEMEMLYLKIITEYPDAPLAQESYWRLTSIYVDENTPPNYEKAESLYHEFLKKYPESPIKNLIEDTLSQSYYKNGRWDKILILYTQAVREFIEKGTLSNPNPIFMYAEAKLNLGDIEEAEKSYKIVIEMFPSSNRASTAKKRLEDIKKRK